MSISRDEIDLRAELKVLLDKFKELLKTYYSYSLPTADIDTAVGKKIKIIYQIDTDISEQYSSILDWCEANEENGFGPVKKTFPTIHEKFFEELIRKNKNKHDAIIADLEKNAAQTSLEENKALEELHQNIEIQDKRREKLMHNIQRVLPVLPHEGTLDPKKLGKFDNLEYRRRIGEIHKRIKENGLKVEREENFEIKKSAEPQDIIYLDRRKQEFIGLLDQQIKQYREALEKENFLKKILMWFSPTRARRHAALAAYTAISKDPARQFPETKQWLNAQFQQTEFANPNPEAFSRFYNLCLVPARSDYKLLNYESISHINLFMQNPIDSIVHAWRERVKKHNVNAEKQMTRFNQTASMSNLLQRGINEFLTLFLKAKKDLDKDILSNGGYPNNYFDELQTALRKLDAIKNTVAEEEQALEVESLLEKYRKRKNSLTESEIHDLTQDMQAFKKNPKAHSVIDNFLETIVIGDLQKRSQGFQPMYMSMQRAQKFIRVIQPRPDQTKKIDQAKSTIEARRKTDLLNDEKLYASVLKKNLALKEQGLKPKLAVWYTAFMAHGSTKNAKLKLAPDIEQEKIYQAQVKKTYNEMTAYHQNSNNDGPLAKLVTKFIEDASKQAVLAPFSPEEKNSLVASLNLNEQDIFVRIYGTEAQKENWQKTTLPSLRKSIEKQSASTPRSQTLPRKLG